MAMAVSDWLADQMLNAAFRGVAFTPPETVYLALYTSDPTRSDTGTEVSGGSYVRKLVVFSAPADVGGKRTIQPTSDIVEEVATADWGTITHAGIRDAETGGNLLYYGALETEKTILTGERLTVPNTDCLLSLN